MTSPTGKSSGFTLLEVLITLAIMALFSGYFLLRFEYGNSGKLLDRASADVREAALLAKKRSSTFRRDQFILFDRKEFISTDRAPNQLSLVSEQERDLAKGESRYQFPQELMVEVLPFGESRWVPLKTHVWRFRASGLSEPLGLRFSVDQSYTVLMFDALTGIADEETFIE